MAIYKSEITQFLEQLKKNKPDIESGQLAGRALLWDKEPISPERSAEVIKMEIIQKAYPYSTK
jgi:Protein of unknown function (DUF3460)